MLEVKTPEPTAQAILAVAVVALELYERLTLCCALGLQPNFSPRAGDEVALGAQFFQQVEGALAKGFFVVILAVAEEHGGNGVDEQEVERTALQALFRGRLMCGTKGVMRLPISLGVRLKQRHDFVLALRRQDL